MKKGFTLIEMIGVMVILSLLLAFAMPNIINYIKKGGDTKDKVLKTVIYDATKKYMDDSKNIFKKDKKNTYCISVYTLAQEGYLESPIKLSSSDEDITSENSTKTVKVTYDNKYKYELVDSCTGIVNPTPVLYTGLTPVYYDETNEVWKVADPTTDEWYNYDEQKWANAVVLGDGVQKSPGDVVTVEETLDANENSVSPDALMMYVWIPRYEYQYTNLGDQYAGGTQELPGEIKINFITKGTTTPSSNEYKVHPAFTFGEKEESGFWVGKFELSSMTNDNSDNNLGCNETICTSNISNLRILPNVSSLRYNDISNFFYAIRKIENNFGLKNIDTHMIKNSEWGAVAYLSQSKYGKYGNNDYKDEKREIYQNKSENYITGNSNGTPLHYDSYTQCTYDQKAGINENQDQNNCGPGASTTGNIYGIYDMVGGSSEYIMGVYGSEENPTIAYSGFSENPNVFTSGDIDSKYYDLYTTNNRITACKGNVCYGHALSETTDWYSPSSNFFYSNFTWIVRSGNFNNSRAIFDVGIFTGEINETHSTRVVSTSK